MRRGLFAEIEHIDSNLNKFMEKPNKVKVGQIGLGVFGKRRRKYLRESGLFELVACYDLRPEAMEQCRIEDGAEPCGSYEEMLARPELEAVIIATGACDHAEQAVAAMERGLHVFIEKPLCSTPEELRQIVECQARTGLAVGTGHHDLSVEDSSVAIERLVRNEIGQPVAFHAVTASSGGWNGAVDSWRFKEGRNPGGMLFQCGVHKIHELRFYFGEVRRVSCLLRGNLRPETPVADSAICTLEFASGIFGTLHAHYVTPYHHTLNIYGTRANVYYENRFGHAGKHLLRQELPPVLDGAFETRAEIKLDCPTDWCGNLRSFYRMVREGGDVYPSLTDAAAAVSVIFAADQSAAEGGAPATLGRT